MKKLIAAVGVAVTALFLFTAPVTAGADPLDELEPLEAQPPLPPFVNAFGVVDSTLIPDLVPAAGRDGRVVGLVRKVDIMAMPAWDPSQRDWQVQATASGAVPTSKFVNVDGEMIPSNDPNEAHAAPPIPVYDLADPQASQEPIGYITGEGFVAVGE